MTLKTSIAGYYVYRVACTNDLPAHRICCLFLFSETRGKHVKVCTTRDSVFGLFHITSNVHK